MTKLNTLDALAEKVAKGESSAAGGLSTGERLYIALASNNLAMLESDGYTIAEALARIGTDWTAELISRWQYRGNPKHF